MALNDVSKQDKSGLAIEQEEEEASPQRLLVVASGDAPPPLLPPPQKSASLAAKKTPIEAIAVDPGQTHQGIIRLKYHGSRYVESEERPGEMVKVPRYEIERWEMWNLKEKIVYEADADWGVHTNRFDNRGGKSESLLEQGFNQAQIIRASEWLFTLTEEGKLPAFVSELQCGFIKNHELAVTVLAQEMATLIHALDAERGLAHLAREIVHGARKYGLPNDGELSYEARKEKSEEIGRGLNHATGKHACNKFLDLLLMAQKRDNPKAAQKVHDMTDAELLALQYCENKWEEREKADDSATPLTRATASRVNVFDSEEEDACLEDMLAAKQSGRRVVRRKPTAVKTVAATKEDKPKASKQKKTPKKKTKTPTQLILDALSDEDDVSLVPPMDEAPKQSKQKKKQSEKADTSPIPPRKKRSAPVDTTQWTSAKRAKTSSGSKQEKWPTRQEEEEWLNQ